MQEHDHGDMLAAINMVRNVYGQEMLTELPNATMGAKSDCLYYRGLSGCGVKSVGSHTIRFDSEHRANLVAELWGVRADGDTVNQPAGMSRVIKDFDRHHLPAYDV